MHPASNSYILGEQTSLECRPRHDTTGCIDLARPRTVIILSGPQSWTYAIRPIREEEWLAYFEGIVSTAERKGAEVVQHIDASGAGVSLVEKLLNNQPDVPLSHKLAIANVLTSAEVPNVPMRGFGEIPLHAIWTAGPKGTMRRAKNLVHVFKEPTAEQSRQYRRDDSRAQIIGGSRKGTTVYRGAQRTLAELYDKLIVSVEGYVVNGEPLVGAEQIARHMDTYHKVAAAARLFTPAEIEIEEDEEE